MKGLLRGIVFAGMMFCITGTVHAQINSPQYKIQDFTIESDTAKTDAQNRILLTSAELDKFNAQGYIIRKVAPGSEAAMKATLYNFQKKNQTISNSISISFPKKNNFQVFAIADHPLQTVWNTHIPFTKCDDGCTVNTARQWNNDTVYGLGLNIQGANKEPDFIDDSYFRKFADASSNNDPVPVIFSSTPINNSDSNLDVKLIQPPDLAEGSYETTFTFFTVPLFDTE